MDGINSRLPLLTWPSAKGQENSPENQESRNPTRVTALLTDGGYVEDGSDHRHQQNGAQVVEEQSIGHKVACVQDDRGQHVEEEGVRGQWGDGHIGAKIEHHPNDHAHDNQQARLRKY